MRPAPLTLVLMAAALAVHAGPSLLAAQQTPAAARPLSLAEALGLAEGESETVGLARADIARAAGERRRARSGYLPQLTGTAAYTRTLRSQFSVLQGDDDGTAPEPAPECARFVPEPGRPIGERLDALEAAVECASAADPFGQFRNLPFGRENEYRLGLSLSQNLLTWGRLGGQLGAASAGLRSAELGLTAARAQLLLDVTQAYYDAALGDRLVAIAEATLRQADTTLGQTRLAQQVGNQSEFELLRAQVARDNQRPAVIQRRAERELAYYRLKQLLNFPLDAPLALTTELGDTAAVPVARLAELVETPGDTASDTRVPVRQAAEGVQAQQGLLRVARSQRLPQLVLSSQFAELGYPAEVSPFGGDFVSDWTVSLGLQVPLFTGGRIRGDVEVARAGVEQAELRLRQTRELVQFEARSALIQLAASEAGWQASAGTVEQAARAYGIAEVRFREGISTQTELLDSRIQLEQAQAVRARAARDLQVAKMRLVLLPALPLGGGGGAAGGDSQQTMTPGAGATPLPPQSVPAAPQQAVAGNSTGTFQAGAASR
jgi:outer membrane protein